jgi:hypothetical protein
VGMILFAIGTIIIYTNAGRVLDESKKERG